MQVEPVEHVDKVQVVEEVKPDEHEPKLDVGFPSGLKEMSLLTSYLIMWHGKYGECGELKLVSYGRKLQSEIALHEQIHNMTIYKGLLSVFANRWHKEANTFHMPVGEMTLTVTLDDVASLLGIPITGIFYNYEHMDKEVVIPMLVGLLGVEYKDVFDETKKTRGGHVCLSCLWGVKKRDGMRQQEPICFIYFAGTKQIGGYATFLQYILLLVTQGWICEHFVTIGARNDVLGYEETSPREIHLRIYPYSLDIFIWAQICTFIFQRGCCASMSITKIFPDTQLGSLMRFPPHNRLTIVQPWDCDVGYNVWLYRVSHPFVQPRYSTSPPDATMDQAHPAI
ncbi:Protein MAIN-LIKE 1 [Glycine max]|nr:Protein MAIN-LIKE 1 [Glycine max]